MLVPYGNLKHNLPKLLSDLLVTNSNCEALACLIVYGSIVRQVHNDLSLLPAFAPAASNKGQDEPFVRKRPNARVILAFGPLLWQHCMLVHSVAGISTSGCTISGRCYRHSKYGKRTEYRVAEMLSRSSKRYSAIAAPGVVVGLTGAVLPRLLDPLCHDINSGPPVATHGRRECTWML